MENMGDAALRMQNDPACPDKWPNIQAGVKHISFFQEVFDRFNVTRLLDLGCGMCGVATVAGAAGYESFGMDDLDDDWHREHRDELREFLNRYNVNFTQGDLYDIPYPFEEASYDAVILKGVIEHFHHSPKPVLDEAVRLLNPGGGCLL